MNILEIISLAGIPYKISGQEIIIKCIVPDCLDKRGHLYFNQSKGLWNCFRCGHRGNIKNFIWYWNKKYNTKYDWRKFSFKEQVSVVKTNIDKKVLEFQNKFVLFHTLKKKNNAMVEFLERRGITKEYWIMFKLGVFKDTNYLNYLVIPVLEDNNVVGYVLRNIYEKKFKTIGNIHNYLYNYDIAKEFPEIYIVEGVFDTFKLINAVAIFGKTLSKMQVFKLSKISKNKVLYLMLDGDVDYTDKLKEAMKLTGICSQVKIINTPKGKDPDELTIEEIELCKSIAKNVW